MKMGNMISSATGGDMGIEKPIQMAICIALSSFLLIQSGRSPWRPKDPLRPEINVSLSDGSQPHNLKDYCLEYHAIFCKFNSEEFLSHQLPQGALTYRGNSEKTVDTSVLAQLAETAVAEALDRKKSFTHFTIVKKSDFNPRRASGLIVLKYKDYPFILKLFLKTPRTFIERTEGVVPHFLYRMGGGTNRHLSGLTRIANRKKIQEKIDESPHWSKLVETPRKWYWAPHNLQWIIIEGKNIGCDGPCETRLPAVYGIIADAIDFERQFSIKRKDDCTFALKFAHYIGDRLDAHVDNLVIEKGTGKIVLIDTEHFPTMVGLKEPMNYNNYISWYVQLSGKCFKANFLRNKKTRRDMQRYPSPELYPLHREE